MELFTNFLLQSQTACYLWKCSKFLFPKIGLQFRTIKISVLPKSIGILAFHHENSWIIGVNPLTYLFPL